MYLQGCNMKAFLSLIILFSLSLHAEHIIYTSDDGDTLQTVVEEKLGEDELSKRDFSLIAFKIKRYNPHIKNWNHLKEGEKIFLAPPLSPYISNFAQAYLQKSCLENSKFFKENPEQKPEECQKY